MSEPITPPTAEQDDPGQPPKAWLRPDGSVIACTEKILVLNENFLELKQLAQDALDDALLMGCSEAQVRAVYRALFDGLKGSFPERQD
ncbi:hypothetical protein [Rhodocyclus purpureus]|uniref:hypothetical protein n=1 Tax=Rhodocyclus purpureus TaxID=1067 RepID=UPI001F5DF2C2|nr:hypothetical protein [Rhodocyclus purpureus]